MVTFYNLALCRSGSIKLAHECFKAKSLPNSAVQAILNCQSMHFWRNAFIAIILLKKHIALSMEGFQSIISIRKFEPFLAFYGIDK